MILKGHKLLQWLLKYENKIKSALIWEQNICY